MFAGKDFTPAQIQEVQKDRPALPLDLKVEIQYFQLIIKKVNSIYGCFYLY